MQGLQERIRAVFERGKIWLVRYKTEIVFAVIIILVSTLSFGLGYLANREASNAPIIIEQHATST